MFETLIVEACPRIAVPLDVREYAKAQVLSATFDSFCLYIVALICYTDAVSFRPFRCDSVSWMDDRHDYLSSLPADLLTNIIEVMDNVSAWLSLSATCQRLRTFMSNSFWQQVFAEYCPGVEPAPWLHIRSSVAIYNKQVCGHC